MKTTIIIPNFNGKKFLPDCIRSLKNQTIQDFKILVVDNGSADGSVEWLRENDIPYIALDTNKGFAGGVNAGIQAAETEYVLLLNNDTVAEPDFVAEMESAIQKSPKLFAVSAMMIKASDHTLIDSAGDGLSILGWAYQRGIDEPVKLYEEPKIVFSACAGAAIYRRKIFEEIGLFDEMHFAYLEDMDVSYRAKLAGYFCYYWPDARVYHLGSATTGSKYNPFKVRLSARNNIYLHYKNQPTLQRIINLPFLAMGIILKGFFFLKKGFFRDYCNGVAEGLETCMNCRKAPAASHGVFTYLALEGEMLRGMLEYTISYTKRHI